MKKLVLLLFCLIWFSSCMRRTPENLLKNQFQIELSDFDYSILSFEEDWILADGECRIVFSFDSITPNNIRYLIDKGAVPFSNKTIDSSYRIPPKYLNGEGYFFYKEEDGHSENYSYFILDLNKKEAVFYYQII